jgi:hypothetical protein
MAEQEQRRQRSSSEHRRSNSADTLSSKVDRITTTQWNTKTVLLLVVVTITVFLIASTQWTTLILLRHGNTLRDEICHQIIANCVVAKSTTEGEISSEGVRLNTFCNENSALWPLFSSNIQCKVNNLHGGNPGDYRRGQGDMQKDMGQDWSFNLEDCRSSMHDSDPKDFRQSHATNQPLNSHWIFSCKDILTFHLAQAVQNMSAFLDKSLHYTIGYLKNMLASPYRFASVVLNTLTFVFRILLVFCHVVMKYTYWFVTSDAFHSINGGFPIAFIIVLWAFGAGNLLRGSATSLIYRGGDTSPSSASRREQHQQEQENSDDKDDDNDFNSDNEDTSWWHAPNPSLPPQQGRKRHAPSAVRHPVIIPHGRSTAEMSCRRLGKREKLALGKARAKQAWLEGKLGKKL